MNQAIVRHMLRGPLVNANPGAWKPKERQGVGKHLEPGVVTYDNDDGSKTTFLLTREAIEKMRPTAAGKPVVGKSGGFDHVKVEKGKKYDGSVTDGFWDGESGWESINFVLTDPKTAEACERGFQFSCAYIPTETDGKPGLWHNVPYDEMILDGEYTHFAVVPTPRYEGATIELLNSTGGIVKETLKKLLQAMVPLSQLKELVNSMEDDEKKKDEADKAAKENAKTERRASAQAAYDASMKNAANDEDRAKAKSAFEKANAEIDIDQAAAATPTGDALPKQPLGGGDVTPEPGVPGQEPGKPALGLNAKPAGEETPEQAQEREKKALEAKNAADDEAKKKAEEEKKNADATAEAKKKEDDEKAKSEKEKQNALKVKAEATAKLDAERRERFNALKRVAEERGGTIGTPFVGVVSATEKEDLGRQRYGSRK